MAGKNNNERWYFACVLTVDTIIKFCHNLGVCVFMKKECNNWHVYEIGLLLSANLKLAKKKILTIKQWRTLLMKLTLKFYDFHLRTAPNSWYTQYSDNVKKGINILCRLITVYSSLAILTTFNFILFSVSTIIPIHKLINIGYVDFQSIELYIMTN